MSYDRDKVIYNSGIKRICENCNHECLATLYCEYCIRNYKRRLINLIRDPSLCEPIQHQHILIHNIYLKVSNNHLQLTRGLRINTEMSIGNTYAKYDWINGRYDEWDSGKKQLKKLKNLEYKIQL
ncbi:hypothetical protein RhiirC2_775641 [Rhizophagus irregularis]|uniref:Uncharacterized protein n=1 Tax=Rhizophagus irregularis TaxID=588596 RepID=A0A2N1NIL5_9GLOM|nr:hypothetical protein RhiirC2_775641 [Rhizophagus irregularis]